MASADIVAGVAPRHEARRLEDIGERAAGELWRAAIDTDGALGRLDQPAHNADHRRLAAAARSQQAGEFALGDRKREAGEDAVGAELYRDIAQFDVRRRLLRGASVSCGGTCRITIRWRHPLRPGRDVGSRAPILPLEARKREQGKNGPAHSARPAGQDAVEPRPSLRVLDERALLGLPPPAAPAEGRRRSPDAPPGSGPPSWRSYRPGRDLAAWRAPHRR